jgi:Lar family restriction alleviation protein
MTTKLQGKIGGVDVELLKLIDGAKPIVECWHAEQAYNVQWKKDWLAKANRVLADPEKATGEKVAALKPCPFCGGGALVIVTSVIEDFIGPQCQRCGANIQNTDKAKAIEFWNCRYPLLRGIGNRRQSNKLSRSAFH